MQHILIISGLVLLLLANAAYETALVHNIKRDIEKADKELWIYINGDEE